jgi:hypothetical protein
MMHEDLLNRFTYHPPTQEQPQKYSMIRGAALQLAQEINRIAPECREKSLAVTKLEEAVMWANAAIARHGGVEPEKSEATPGPDHLGKAPKPFASLDRYVPAGKCGVCGELLELRGHGPLSNMVIAVHENDAGDICRGSETRPIRMVRRDAVRS